jgi:hypothetical protein
MESAILSAYLEEKELDRNRPERSRRQRAFEEDADLEIEEEDGQGDYYPRH